MAGISPVTSVRPYLALPSPESVRAAAGSGPVDRVEKAPVQPVPPVTRRTEQPEEDRRRSAGRAAEAGTAAPSFIEGGGTGGGASSSSSAPASGPLRFSPSSGGGGGAGFAAQQLSQESVGPGLYIEPWQAALSSYRSADALPASARRSGSTSLVV